MSIFNFSLFPLRLGYHYAVALFLYVDCTWYINQENSICNIEMQLLIFNTPCHITSLCQLYVYYGHFQQIISCDLQLSIRLIITRNFINPICWTFLILLLKQFYLSVVQITFRQKMHVSDNSDKLIWIFFETITTTSKETAPIKWT